MQNLSVYSLESGFFFSILLKVSKKGISDFIGFTLKIIYPKMVSK